MEGTFFEMILGISKPSASVDFTDILSSVCNSTEPVISVHANVAITIIENSNTDLNLPITISVLYVLKLFFYCICAISEILFL